VCGRAVDRSSPALKGVWFTAVPAERIALCARQHGAPDRRGHPVVAGTDRTTGDVRSDVPLIERADGALVALVPPHGVELARAEDGGYDVFELDELRPSDLVGTVGRHGRWIGSVDDQAVRRDAEGRAVSIEAVRLSVLASH
jgi:hypothetical protein